MKELYLRIFKRRYKKEDTVQQLIRNINNALNEIYFARTNFDMAVGSDNIELAIYELSTAEIKYQNLIREAKRLGILRCNPPVFPTEEAEEG